MVAWAVVWSKAESLESSASFDGARLDWTVLVEGGKDGVNERLTDIGRWCSCADRDECSASGQRGGLAIVDSFGSTKSRGLRREVGGRRGGSLAHSWGGVRSSCPAGSPPEVCEDGWGSNVSLAASPSCEVLRT